MKKQRVLDKLEQEWTAFIAAHAGLTEAQMVTPGVTGDWSVKDLMAHVSWWEEEALKHLPAILQGSRPQTYSVVYGGIDAFNAHMTEQRRGLTLAEVQKRMDETHHRLIEYVQTVDDEHFATGSRFRNRLRLDTFSHYPIHARAIREWRERLDID